MLDLSFIGKNGIMFQYEDIISLIGYNIIKAMRSINTKVQRMSDEDILLDYFNRDIMNQSEYMKSKYGIEMSMDSIYQSKKALYPNMLYAYRIIDTAYTNGIRLFLIHSNQYSEIIEKYISQTFAEWPVKYVYGDIIPVLQDNSNITYMTSDVQNIEKCININNPFALTIVDDFMYTSPVAQASFAEKLRKKGVFVSYTSILSGGLFYQ